MLLGQANKGKKRKNSGNTKRNLNKKAAVSYANLSSSSYKYMSNLSKDSEFEEIEEEIEESSIIEGFNQDSELSSETNTLSSKAVSCREMTEMTESTESIIEKLSQSSFWKEHEYSLNCMEKDIDALRKENTALRQRLMLTEGRLTRAEKKLDEAQEKILDLTTRSMRDNLVIKNVEEKKGESEELIKGTLTSMFKDRLKLTDEDLQSVQIDRVHRVGKPRKPGSRPRNIVAKLSSKGKSTIMSKIKLLERKSDNDIKISEQFPPEVHARRNKLWPLFLQAKQTGQQAKFNVDKLIVDNKLINSPQDKVKDINLDVTGTSMSMKPKSTAVMTMDRSHFQGHIVPIKSSDEVIPAIQSLCKDQRVAGSTHIMYAYRIGDQRYNISNWDDDGEFGAGRVIMNALDSKQFYNHLEVVTRWYGGQHLGPSRFDHIKKMAHDAMSL